MNHSIGADLRDLRAMAQTPQDELLVRVLSQLYGLVSSLQLQAQLMAMEDKD